MKQLNLYYLGGGGPSPSVPDGKTVTPINDVTIWQQCAGLTPVYTSLGEVLSDSGYTAALMSDNNAVDYMVRSTDWASLPVSIVPTMTSDTAPSGQCFCVAVNSSYPPYRAFDRNDSTQATMSNTSIAATDPSYIGYMFAEPVTVSKATIYQTSYTYNNCYIQYSDDGVEYKNASNLFTVGKTSQDVNFEPATGKYWRLYVGSLAESTASARPIYSLQFYSGSVVTSQIAMTAIGNSNYASNTLLADSTWRNAIRSSTYFESVLNVKVPVMTSNTTPSGECFGSGTEQGDYYLSFDGNDSSTPYLNPRSPSKSYVGYMFNEAVTILKVHLQTRSDKAGHHKIQGSEDGLTWEDLTADTATGSSNYIIDFDIDSTKKYKYIRDYGGCDSSTAYANFVYTLQFYSREDV